MALFTKYSQKQAETLLALMYEELHGLKYCRMFEQLRQALVTFVLVETGVDIQDVPFKMDGRKPWFDVLCERIEEKIDRNLDIGERELEREYINGRYKIQVFSQDYRTGHMWIIYKIYHDGQLVFWGGDVGLPTGHDIKSDSTIGAMLNLLEYRGEDSHHTPAQLEFLENHDYELAQIGMELGDPGDLS